MVSQFNFSSFPSIIFGPGKISELFSLADKMGDRVLIITGNASHKSNQKILQQFTLFESSGKHFFKRTIIQEPTVKMIDDIVTELIQEKIDLIIAIGGGSVLDAGKAISAMLTINGTIARYLEGSRDFIMHPGTHIPLIGIPTTAGTGSEVTKNAVILETGVNGFKRSLRHDHFIPEIALIDPEICLNCPKPTTAYSGMDAFTQLLESYVSTRANPMSDAFAISGLEHLAVSLERVYEDGLDLEARSAMSYAALCSGISLANAGLGTVHGFASSVGGRFDIPHGLICGTLVAAVTEQNIKKLRILNESDALVKYAKAGKIFHNSNNRSDEFYLDFLIGEIYRLTAKLKIPELTKAGFDESEITNIAKKTSCKNNPVQQTEDELIGILEKRS